MPVQSPLSRAEAGFESAAAVTLASCLLNDRAENGHALRMPQALRSGWGMQNRHPQHRPQPCTQHQCGKLRTGSLNVCPRHRALTLQAGVFKWGCERSILELPFPPHSCSLVVGRRALNSFSIHFSGRSAAVFSHLFFPHATES